MKTWNVKYDDRLGMFFIEKAKAKDARLIACVPAMLELLEQVHTELILQGASQDEELFSKIDKILKKARG